ncbi:E3 binding domain-containing protein [Pseudarthrobacter raffinosi]|uniref:E3 binding domain-containing protein n=1 Tax=Pseudarthrobacter raffinosi TaxID=2953651 RepID=UPI00208E4A8F|nr:E3 binding domain-containing protein [Pseudarthrobacter sp. MDT3-9]MCO4253153.1 E3 binding domain-containing protein [Pseudarthrobacter sp. MDT3-9]
MAPPGRTRAPPGGFRLVQRQRPPEPEAQKAADDLLLLRTRVPGKLGAVISPLVRRIAREHGVDLGAVHGSGDRRADHEQGRGGRLSAVRSRLRQIQSSPLNLK